MPDKPIWCGHLDRIVGQLRELPDPWVDRLTLERILGVGRRRAQQILSPCSAKRIGGSYLAEREAVIAHLHRLAAGESARYEQRRRSLLAKRLDTLHREQLEKPRVLVEAPVAIVNRDLDGLPNGVTVAPGRIAVSFETGAEALEKLLALAMAIGNDLDRFERLAAKTLHTAEASSTDTPVY